MVPSLFFCLYNDSIALYELNFISEFSKISLELFSKINKLSVWKEEKSFTRKFALPNSCFFDIQQILSPYFSELPC